MAKDSLQPTWKKTLSGVITAIGVDNNGTVWAGDGAGKLSRFTSDGISSEPIYLDNPICSISVDKNTNDIYVGDLANNVYKYTSNGERKWGKNLGTGSIDAISIISTINNIKPDDKGNFDLTDKYYSQEQINSLIAPLGKTKSVNGNVPNDAGNITVDLSGYYAYKGALNDDSDLDKNLATGWYALHSGDGSTSILLVYSDKNISGMQVRIATDKSISVRYKESGKYTDWAILTKNVQSINNIKPDKDGNVDLDLTGNIKTVNRIKPDENGNIQLGAGSINSVKSINNNYYPDKTGNVQVPEFSLNLLPNTSDTPTEIKKNSNVKNINLWSAETDKSSFGYAKDYPEQPQLSRGEQLTADTPADPNTTYIASFSAWTLQDTIQLPDSMGLHYTMWRNPKITLYIVCKDENGNEIKDGVYKYKYHFKQEESQYQGYISVSFTTPPATKTVALWYNGYERTDPNNIVQDAGQAKSTSYGMFVNKNDQVTELDSFQLSNNPKGKDVTFKIQAYISNYKKGSFFTLKTKGMDGNAFKLDSSNLDSDKRLIKAIPDIDEHNLVTGNGFYSWEYTMAGEDLYNYEMGTGRPVPITNIVGNIEYTIKLVINDGDSNPDMEWTSGYGYLSNLEPYNKLKLFNFELYNQSLANVVDLGTYKLSDSHGSLASTAGKYSASCVLDMRDSTGFCRLALQKYDTKTGDIVNEETSKKLPVISTDDDGSIEAIKKSVCYIDELQNDDPKATEAIRLRLYVFGQTSSVYINKIKLAKWVDDDTPPDLNWLPNLNDIGKVQSVNGILPDSAGDIILHGIDNPDYDYSSTDTFDVDKATQTGVYRFMDSKVIASIKPEALNGLFTTYDGTKMCGYLFVLNHDSFNREQILFLNHGSSDQDTQIAIRSISGTNNWRPVFRRLLCIDDYVNLQSYIRDLKFLNDDAGRNIYSTTINIDSYKIVGITHFLGSRIYSETHNPEFDYYRDNECYGWIINVPHWNGASIYTSIVYLAGDSAENSGYKPALYTRVCDNVTAPTAWVKLSTNADISSALATVNTFSNPMIIDENTATIDWLDSLSKSGVYYIPDAVPLSRDKELASAGLDKLFPAFIFVYSNFDAGYNVIQSIVQPTLSKFNVISRNGLIDSAGNVYSLQAWHNIASDIDNVKNDLTNLKSAVNDKLNDLDRVRYANNEVDAVNLSRDHRGIIYYWY